MANVGLVRETSLVNTAIPNCTAAKRKLIAPPTSSPPLFVALVLIMCRGGTEAEESFKVSALRASVAVRASKYKIPTGKSHSDKRESSATCP